MHASKYGTFKEPLKCAVLQQVTWSLHN